MTSFLPLGLGALGSPPARPRPPRPAIRRKRAPHPGGAPLSGSESLLQVTRALCARLSAWERHEAMRDDLTAAQRALLADLARHGPTTLPQLARARSVTRQQVRVVVEALTRRRLVRRLSNPAHRRSYLVGVTTDGSRKAREIEQWESRRLGQIERVLGAEGIRDGTLALRSVLDALDECLER